MGGEGESLGKYLESYIIKQSGKLEGLGEFSWNEEQEKYGSVLNVWVIILKLEGFKEWNKFAQAVKSFEEHLDTEEEN